MAGLKELKTRIGSVTNTQKITQAMKMVSVARLRKAQERILNLRDYAQALKQVLLDVTLSEKVNHPFLEQKKPEDIKRILLVVITSDRGLCGGFNTVVCRETEKFLDKNDYESIDLFFIGRKGADYFKFRGLPSKRVLLNLAKTISYPLSARISEDLMKDVSTGVYDATYMVYNEFKTLISPQVVFERLIPFDLESVESEEKNLFAQDLIFEVDPLKLLNSLLERYFAVQVYRCLCESIAAEHGSRMASMENATKNAGDVISKLTLNYNKLRQNSITTELIEIVAGVEALKK